MGDSDRLKHLKNIPRVVCSTVRPGILLAALCLSVSVGLWQVDSAREALRGKPGPAATVLPLPGDASPESGAAAASLEDDLWDVYPVVLDIRQDIFLVPSDRALLPADLRTHPARERLIFHVPS